MTKVVVVLLLSLLFPDPISSSAPYPFKVKVVVDAEGGIGKTLTGYIHRELRKLEDVEIDIEDPEWTISIVLLSTKNKRGNHTGYAVSFVVTRHLGITYVQANIPDISKGLASDLCIIVHHSVAVFPDMKSVYDGLSSICLEFDVDSLEPVRQQLKKRVP